MVRPRTVKPDLKMVAEAPAHLSDRSKALWGQIIPDRGVSPGRLALLEVGLGALDRATEAREILKAEGMFTKTETTGALHAHPAVKVERDAMAVFTRIWSELGLSWDGRLDGGLG